MATRFCNVKLNYRFWKAKRSKRSLMSDREGPLIFVRFVSVSSYLALDLHNRQFKIKSKHLRLLTFTVNMLKLPRL